MHRLGIEQLSIFGMLPVELVNLAADLGCSCISAGMTGFGYNPHGYPEYSLRDDTSLRHETIAALRDRGVTITLGEGCTIRPGRDVRDFARDMDVFRELGTVRMNTVSMDPDLDRTLDQLGAFAEMAAERGMVSTIEMCPVLTIGNLAAALAAVRHVGRTDFRLLLDSMHLGRSGATGADVAALDPGLIDYFQISDASAVPTEPNYMIEGTFERRVPGEGDMPLADYIAALPADVVVSIEVPQRSLAEAGVGPAERLRPALAATRALLGQTEMANDR